MFQVKDISISLVKQTPQYELIIPLNGRELLDEYWQIFCAELWNHRDFNDVSILTNNEDKLILYITTSLPIPRLGQIIVNMLNEYFGEC